VSLYSGSVSVQAGNDTSPRDQRCGSGSEDIAAAALSSVTHGYNLDTLRCCRGGGDATQSTWLRVSLDHESVKNRIGDAQLTIEVLDRYKPREIERPAQPRYPSACGGHRTPGEHPLPGRSGLAGSVGAVSGLSQLRLAPRQSAPGAYQTDSHK